MGKRLWGKHAQLSQTVDMYGISILHVLVHAYFNMKEIVLKTPELKKYGVFSDLFCEIISSFTIFPVVVLLEKVLLLGNFANYYSVQNLSRNIPE